MSAACNTSKSFAASTIVHPNRCKLVSVLVSSIANAANVIKIFDSHDATTASSDEVLRIYTKSDNSGANVFNHEHDMHGAIMGEGLYVEITGSGSCPVTVNYA